LQDEEFNRKQERPKRYPLTKNTPQELLPKITFQE